MSVVVPGLARLDRPVLAIREHAWALYLLPGLAAATAYVLVPSAAAQTALLLGLDLSAVFAVAAGVRLHGPRSGLPWLLLAAGQLAAFASNALWQAHILARGEAPAPGGVSDVFWVASYGSLIAVLALLLLRRTGRRQTLVDTGIVAAGVSIVAWAFLVQGYLDQSSPLLERGTQIAYAFLDLAVLALLVRLALGAVRWNVSGWALVAGSAALLFSDGIWNWSTLIAGSFSPGTWADAGWLVLPLLAGAAALHPSMRTLFDHGPVPEPGTWTTIGVLGVAALAGPAVLGGAEAYGQPISPYPLAAAAAVLVVLVLLRLAGLLSAERRADEALRASEERYRELFEGASDFLYTMDLDGRFTSVNRAAATVTGYRPAELVGRHADEIIAPEHGEAATREFARKLAGEAETTTYELEVIAKDGRRVPLEVSSRPLRANGAIAGFQGTARNLGERRRLEAQLRHSQKMEAIGQLAGSIAHDFNNLLTAINGYAEFVLASPDLTAGLRRDVEQICQAGDRAAALTGQLLAFSRRQVLEPKTLELNAVVADLATLLRRLIGEDVELVLALGNELGRVKADPDQLGQVIMNLALNARDAMPEGGTLAIETAGLDVDGSASHAPVGLPAGSYVRLSLTDTGIGMDTDTIARAFEPFFTTKEAGKGTGLGLATVYGIVTQSGGAVTAESTPGRGSTFAVYLPQAHGGEELGTAAAATSSAAGGSETVLLAEDERFVRELAARVLREHGYRVLTAVSGSEALRVAEGYEGRIHLLVTDIVMPGLGGFALAERLRSARPDLAVLYVSGYADGGPGDPQRQPLGAILEKPFTPAALSETVRKTLDAAPQTLAARTQAQ